MRKGLCAILLVMGVAIVLRMPGAGSMMFSVNRWMEATLAGLDEYVIDIGDHKWHYYAKDLGQPVCRVLLHGFTAEASHWFRLARHLDRDTCVIIPDLPGFGSSAYAEDASYAPDTQRQRLDAFLSVVSPASVFDLVGSSMGGHIALLYALEHPRRVRSLTLMDAGGIPSPTESPATRVLASTGHPVFDVRDRESFARMMAMTMEDPPWMPAEVQAAIADEFIARNARYRRIFVQIYEKDGVASRLASIGCPTLVMWGQNDQITDVSMAYALQAGIPAARLTLVPGTGHLPFLEAPRQTAVDVERFWHTVE